MPAEGDLGVSYLAVVLVVLVGPVVIGFVVRRKWRISAARREEIKRLSVLASEEAARAELEASFGYDATPAAISPPLQYQCAVCFCPTPTRCARCKAVKYCSGKCQTIHWRRQGHREECRPFTSSYESNDEGGCSCQKLLKQEEYEIHGNSFETDGRPYAKSVFSLRPAALEKCSPSWASPAHPNRRRRLSDSGTKVDEESFNAQLTELRKEDEASRDEAFQEFLRCKNLEAEAVEAISKVKALESAHARELKLRKEAEDALKMTLQEQEKLSEEREEATNELHKAMRIIALLDSRAQEANRRREEAAGELKLIQASISALRHEKNKIRRQKMEASRWLDRWKSRGQAGAAAYNELSGFTEDSPEVVEFSLTDLQTATCNFSESFKIGQSGYGCVYKGELLDRTVAIKKLHPHNMQRQSDFEQQVQVLGKLQHPHLVTLIGICPDAWSLVYEYLPNGSLQDCFFRRSNICSLTWKIRARLIAEISSALLFLHLSKPEKIVHGNLKPENVLLNSDLVCKICDFGLSRLVPEETLRCPSFGRNAELKGAFSYTDPEFHRTGSLSPKSDVYSFGLIILQLLTGRDPVGLAGEVRKAVSCGKLTSILDSSAGEWPNFVSKKLVDIGLQCCESKSRDRPELTPSLVRELEQLHTSEERPVPSFFLCPILQEIMHDPQVAADGFTYEGDALRGWLENGRETSPMTNLKLDHLHLTPNHSLRLAIQDWFCKS